MNKTAEKFKRLCNGKGIQVHFKGTNTLRTTLGNPKDKDPATNQTGVIYKYQCPHINCPSSYIGESGRSLEGKVQGNISKPPPPYTSTVQPTGHPMDPEQFSIVHKEVNMQSRTIKKAMFIHVQDPPKQKPGQISFTTYMGSTSTGFTNIPTQTNTTANFHCQLITPPTGTTSLYAYTPFPLPIWMGGTNFSYFLMVSKCIYLKQPPLSLSTIGLQQQHLGKLSL